MVKKATVLVFLVLVVSAAGGLCYAAGPPEMVQVPAGWFLYQGTTWTHVPEFYIDKYEVTNECYCEFLNDPDPCDPCVYYDARMEITQYSGPGDPCYWVDPGRENHPIRWVNFYDAEAYAAWLTAVTPDTYRLPDEEEWEKAAGWDPLLNKLWTYGFQSDTIDCSSCNYNNCVGDTTPVRDYDPCQSYYGGYDMSGNVWEWTRGMKLTKGVLRGGSYNHPANDCRTIMRGDTPRGTAVPQR